jgi:hypothetical protein
MRKLDVIPRDPSFPLWAKYAAQDKDGEISLFSELPRRDDEDGFWYNSAISKSTDTTVQLSLDIDWTQSVTLIENI